LGMVVSNLLQQKPWLTIATLPQPLHMGKYTTEGVRIHKPCLA
jgi:hypothetical protein